MSSRSTVLQANEDAVLDVDGDCAMEDKRLEMLAQSLGRVGHVGVLSTSPILLVLVNHLRGLHYRARCLVREFRGLHCRGRCLGREFPSLGCLIVLPNNGRSILHQSIPSPALSSDTLLHHTHTGIVRTRLHHAAH